MWNETEIPPRLPWDVENTTPEAVKKGSHRFRKAATVQVTSSGNRPFIKPETDYNS